jgi:hypothetical protein
MQALVVVVPHVPTKLVAKGVNGLKRSPVDHVGLEGVEERLHVGVLPRGTATRHALAHTARRSPRAHRRPLKLAAAIGVDDQPGIGPSTTERRVQHRPGRA